MDDSFKMFVSDKVINWKWKYPGAAANYFQAGAARLETVCPHRVKVKPAGE